MDERTKKTISRSAWTTIVLFIIRYLVGLIDGLDFLKCDNWYDYFGAAGEAISVATVILLAYNKWIWQFNPFDSTPKLKGSYTGRLYYNNNGQKKSKSISVFITQTSLRVSVKITTNEITSNTITSDLIEENGEMALYYTYITNPSSQYSDQNPIQHGTCRLIQKEKNKLEGQYWTSRKTIGDIKLTKQ